MLIGEGLFHAAELHLHLLISVSEDPCHNPFRPRMIRGGEWFGVGGEEGANYRPGRIGLQRDRQTPHIYALRQDLL